MAIESTTIVTLYDDAAKTKAFAPRTKVSAISNDNGTDLQTLLDNKLSLSGGTLTGNLTGKYITGTWLQNTANTNLGSASSKVVVQDSSGWLYYRTPAQILSDAGVTSTVAELNYIDGVTSNIQTQLNEKAPSSHSHNVIVHQDTRDINQTPDQMPTGISIHLKSNGKDGLSDGGTFHPLLCLKDWGDYSGGPYGQLSITANQNMWFRASASGSAWGSWKKVLDSSNYSSYALPLSGGSLSGGLTAPVFGATQHMTISAGLVQSMADGQSRWFGNGIAFSNPTTKNDQGWLRVTGTGEADTVFEIATGDDGGAGETIAVRQYNTSNTISRELILLNTSGNTTFPGSVYKRGQNVPSTFVQSGQPTGTFQTGDIWFVT